MVLELSKLRFRQERAPKTLAARRDRKVKKKFLKCPKQFCETVLDFS